MASPGVLPSLLRALTPRPPTPPRETVVETEAQKRQLLAASDLHPTSSSLHTPPGANTPGSGISSSRRKKVGFSAQAQYQEPPVYIEGEAKKVPTPISLPSSTGKAIKSILKVTYGSNPLAPNIDSADSTCPNANLSIMLDSSIQHLAGADRDSRVDAYMMLIRALKASNNLPDRVALQEKMGLFMQFIQRDITAKTPTGLTDSSLVNQSLNLLVTFLNFPAIASTLTNDFAIYMVEHCIRSFEDPSTSKEVVRHLMQVIAFQRFSVAKVMTVDRVGRLIASLHKIEEHVKGKSIDMARLHSYKKLAGQCRQAMVVHSDWLYDLFAAMLSELKDIRNYAINLGLEAGFIIGREKSITRKTMEIFNQQNEAGDKKYIELYTERLTAMVHDKTDPGAVPQIWSVVMLFLRISLDRWNQMGRWLKIIQLCFNSSDLRSKIEANAAWCRLAYLMLMDEKSSAKAHSILTQPFNSQLRRKEATGKQADEFRQSVLGGIRHLLYYTFRPNANLTFLDSQWDNCVKVLLTQMLSPSTTAAYDGTNNAAAILAGLFDCTTPRVWKEERVTEKSFIEASELPAIDPKWVRRNAARVFELVEPIMLMNINDLNNTASPTHRLWRNLVHAVSSAAAKEIKVSLDTTLFVAQALNLLQKMWKQGPPEGAGNGFLKAVQAYLCVMVDSLGLLPFSDKQLSLDKEQQFVPIATPTHRPNKGQATKTPLKHLFSFLSTLPNNVPDNEKYYEFFSAVLSPFMANKSEKGRMELAMELLSTIPMEATIPWAPWEFASEKLVQWLTYNNMQTIGSGSDTPIGHEYREYVRLLERAWRSTPGLPQHLWVSLFHTIVSCVGDEAGEAGVAIVVIEPLAKVIHDLCSAEEGQPVSPKIAGWIQELVSTAVQPRDRQAVDAARRRLWGSGPRSGSASFDTFDNLYKATNLVLRHAYETQGFADREVASLLVKVGEFLERCNPQLVAKSLLALQSGLAPWIQDEQADTHRQSKEVVQATKSTWLKVCAVLSGYDRSQQLQLDSLEPLLSAAFASKHIQVVNSAVELWNRVFEDTDDIQYPEKLKGVLQDLCKRVVGLEIHLPGLDGSSLELSSSKEPYFVDSQSLDDVQLPQLQTAKSSNRSTPRATPRPRSRAASSRLSSPAVRASGHTSKKRSLDLTTNERLAKMAKRNTPTPKLRHDDSQIQFAPIEESSPVLQEEAESQALTDRQREVRERQKETATIFREIRSSPTRKTKASSRPSSAKPTCPPAQLPEVRRAATPEPTRNLEDYVSSTPTPRRGLPVVLPYQDSDMADVPSSPPEPRRNPLLQEIQSRSASKTALDDWQFSSSPVGSPVHPRHAAEEQASQMVLDDDVMMSDVDVDLPTANDSHDQLEPELGESAALERIVQESIIKDKSTADDSHPAESLERLTEEMARDELLADDTAKKTASSMTKAIEDPSTPSDDYISDLEKTPELPSPAVAEPPSSSQSSETRRKQRASQSSQSPTRPATRASSSTKPKPTPASRPSTRRASTRNAASTAGSFEYSELDDSSLQRLVVEIDAKVNSEEYEYRQVTESPAETKRVRKLNETPKRRRAKKSDEIDAKDCIVVSSPYKAAGEEGALSSIPETIPEEPEVVESSQVSHASSGRSSRRKRKRGNAAALAAARKKKSLRRKNADIQEEDEAELATQESVDLSMSQPGFAMSFSSVAESVPESQLSKRSEATQADGDDTVIPVETEDVEHEIQSQIEQEAARQTQEPEADAIKLEPVAEVAKEKASAGQTDDAAYETAKEAPIEVFDETPAGFMDAELVQEATKDAPVQPQPESPSPFQKLIGFFRGGLEVLKSAALSRTETLQVEDMFMDVRRELIEAEVRGRAASS